MGEWLEANEVRENKTKYAYYKRIKRKTVQRKSAGKNENGSKDGSSSHLKQG